MDYHLDEGTYEKQQKWRKVKEKWVPLILKWRAAGYSKKEIEDFLHDMFQKGELTLSEYLIIQNKE